tara:strand:+ start:1331 stop:1504 length:174 start_codon:yes stop_codon:yes gene_type:complete
MKEYQDMILGTLKQKFNTEIQHREFLVMSDSKLISILQSYGYSERHIERMLLWRNTK